MISSSWITQQPDVNKKPLGAVDGTIHVQLATLQQLQVHSLKVFFTRCHWRERKELHFPPEMLDVSAMLVGLGAVLQSSENPQSAQAAIKKGRKNRFRKKWGAQGFVFGPIHFVQKPAVGPCRQLVETQ